MFFEEELLDVEKDKIVTSSTEEIQNNEKEKESKPELDTEKEIPVQIEITAITTTEETIKEPGFSLETCQNAEELEGLGMEKLKTLLQSQGLLCGGTLKERALRLFSTKGKKPEEYDPKILAKSSNSKKRKK